MICLELKREPHWLDLGHGVRVYVKPCTTALMMAARAEAQQAAISSASDTEAAGIRTTALIKALARLAILDWEGVGDAAGNAVPITPDSVDALMDLADRQRLRECIPRSGAAAGRRKKRTRARADWHFGGGPGYCAGCNHQQRPCARGEPGPMGSAAPTSSMSR